MIPLVKNFPLSVAKSGFNGYSHLGIIGDIHSLISLEIDTGKNLESYLKWLPAFSESNQFMDKMFCKFVFIHF